MSLSPELDVYMSGQCHALAVALHRNLGWALVAVINDDVFFWEDPLDSDNGIPEVLHLYAVDSEHRAWDIRGTRPASTIRTDAADWFCADEESLSTDWMKSETELACYVGEGVDAQGNPFDRPLVSYSDEEVAQAWRVAQQCLSSCPHWPVSGGLEREVLPRPASPRIR